VGTSAECNIATAQVDQLRDAEACLQSKQQKHSIASTRASSWISRTDQSLDLGASEEVDGSFLIPLRRHRQNLLAVMQKLRLIARNVFKPRLPKSA
jgi:hypothetical protein